MVQPRTKDVMIVFDTPEHGEVRYYHDARRTAEAFAGHYFTPGATNVRVYRLDEADTTTFNRLAHTTTWPEDKMPTKEWRDKFAAKLRRMIKGLA
jgi:hypothetical protein